MAHTAVLSSLDAAGVEAVVERLRGLGGPLDEPEAIDQIAALERLKSAAAAAQARVTATLHEGRVARETDEGVPAAERGRGLGEEVGLARRESATLGSRHLGLARALVHELPGTLEHLSGGTVSEWGATLMAKETAVLEPEDRVRVDAVLAERMATMTPRQIERAARAMAQTIDPAAAVRRRARAKGDRRVTIRPQPDTMASVSGLVPVEQGVAAWAALRRDAEAAKAQGDERGLGQLMADLFVERLTGQSRAEDVPVEVQLVMAPGTLLGTGDSPATMPGHGPLPAELARELVLGTESEVRAGGGTSRASTEPEGARRWLRRVFTDEAGRVTAVDPHRRRFPEAVRRLLRLRDGVCRFPFCHAPIRHDDHVIAAVLGGETNAANGQGLCARHNLTKARPGWRARAVGHDQAADVVTETPTGHRYRSPVPPVLDVPPDTQVERVSLVEERLEEVLGSLRPRRPHVRPPDLVVVEYLDTG